MRLPIYLFLSFFLACGPKPPISAEQYQDILLQIHACEAYQELKPSSDPKTFLEDCKSSILKKLNRTKEDFDKTTLYYKERPLELEKIYDTLLIKYP